MNRELVIRIVLPRWLKRRWVLVAGALVLGSAAAVYATVPNAFSAGDVLSAQKLNDNFGALVDLTSDQTIAGAKTFSSDAVVKTGSTDTELHIVNSTAQGHDYALSSAGTGSTAGVGNLNIVDSTLGTTRLSIDSNGRVGVRNHAPQSALDVWSSNGDLLRLVAADSAEQGLDVSWNGALNCGTGSAPCGETDFTNRAGGGSGGFGFFNLPTTGSATEIASIDSVGAFHQSSDARLKTNVRAIEHALDDIQHLRGVRFNWKQNGKASIGVIAQEVEAVYPELVSTAPNGTKMVDYASLAGPLIEATKELHAENRALKERIERIEARLDRRASR